MGHLKEYVLCRLYVDATRALGSQALLALRHQPCSTDSQVLSPFYRLNLHMPVCSMASLTFIPYDCCPVVRWGIPIQVPCVEQICGEQVISSPVSPSPLDACRYAACKRHHCQCDQNGERRYCSRRPGTYMGIIREHLISTYMHSCSGPSFVDIRPVIGRQTG